MIDNDLHNLLMQMSQENKSLWRISTQYLRDAEGNAELTDFWNSVKSEKEARIAQLKDLISARL